MRAWHADTINELEKTRKLLQVQHTINKDYKSQASLCYKVLSSKLCLCVHAYMHVRACVCARVWLWAVNLHALA